LLTFVEANCKKHQAAHFFLFFCVYCIPVYMNATKMYGTSTLLLVLCLLQGTTSFVLHRTQASKVTSVKSSFERTYADLGRVNGNAYKQVEPRFHNGNAIRSEPNFPPLTINRENDNFPRGRRESNGISRVSDRQRSAFDRPERVPFNGRESAAFNGQKRDVERIWESSSPVRVEGGSLRTWSFVTPAIERVQVLMKSEGRPIHATLDLWQGPDNSPMQMKVYIEDGDFRPFNAIIETPGDQNSIAIRNTAQMEFPMAAALEANLDYTRRHGAPGLEEITQRLAHSSRPVTVQGGAVRTYPFDSYVDSVQIMLRTDGRPLTARIEMMQGPNNNKQVIDLYVEDGKTRPFVAIVETPGSGNVVRIVNTATVEFPMYASVEPYMMKSGRQENEWNGGDYFVLDRQ
jgi:predicted secreted protein